VEQDRTTAVVQQYLNELANIPGDSPAEPIVRELLSRSVNRLHLLCATLLYRSYPRLARPPLNLQPDEMLSAVVERMIKAMRQVRPENVRQFFALANQHMRWELNDLARRLDKQVTPVAIQDSMAAALPESRGSLPSPNTQRILDAIDALPEEEREAFSLVRIQGLTHPEAASVLGVSSKTIQRRLNRGLILLTEKLGDMRSGLKDEKDRSPNPV
jgi:RNA polymerase sigma-70 factor (ECF subfamily)